MVRDDAEMHGPEEGTRSELVHAADPFRSGTAADENEGKEPLEPLGIGARGAERVDGVRQS